MKQRPVVLSILCALAVLGLLVEVAAAEDLPVYLLSLRVVRAEGVFDPAALKIPPSEQTTTSQEFSKELANLNPGTSFTLLYSLSATTLPSYPASFSIEDDREGNVVATATPTPVEDRIKVALHSRQSTADKAFECDTTNLLDEGEGYLVSSVTGSAGDNWLILSVCRFGQKPSDAVSDIGMPSRMGGADEPVYNVTVRIVRSDTSFPPGTFMIPSATLTTTNEQFQEDLSRLNPNEPVTLRSVASGGTRAGVAVSLAAEDPRGSAAVWATPTPTPEGAVAALSCTVTSGGEKLTCDTTILLKEGEETLVGGVCKFAGTNLLVVSIEAPASPAGESAQ